MPKSISFRKTKRMDDDVTRRVELSKFATKAEIKEFVDAIVAQWNAYCRMRGSSAVWEAVVHDPGYDSGEEGHYGIHCLYNAHDKKVQFPHIDGMGHPENFDGNLCNFEGPLSCAVLLSRHKNTQFGEVYPLANRFSAFLAGEISKKYA